MKSLLVHGCYDADTLRTLKEIGVRHFGFDLRGRSPNLIPFYHLKDFLKDLGSERVHLIFENDKSPTILSFMSLLSETGNDFFLEFRDELSAEFYDSFNRPFVWMFSPTADWKSILMSKNIKGILLPVTFSAFYQVNPKLWEMIEKRELLTYLHSESFNETLELKEDPDVLLSMDLSRDIEKSFRKVDQSLLKKEMMGIL